MATGLKTGAMIAASAVVLAGLATGLVFATTALFTDEGTVTGRITAGDMKIGLYETACQEKALDDDGYLSEGDLCTYEEPFDLLNGDDKALFEIEKAIPGVWTEKTIMIDGAESDVAFGSTLEVVSLTGTGESGALTTAEETLAENITITVTLGEDATQSFKLSEYESAEIVGLGTCTAGESLTFKIKAEFDGESDVTSEEISGAAISFDIHITATQVTEAV